ncbi:SMI1/KNR4 family protein [Nannocystis sp. RBIL2]|uniref:SMI1/KNR4 family protein n=1 Tax=Nannocystis sp. RBIL2 TaxID=2996788 RepID=UPI00226EF993|nr:SMI1/KNR4 family protein [Nannocystis sp. RBIL2]MCY1072167.1 SMI1/KNR4 family protein [Nannocystis sp. RBIL2]
MKPATMKPATMKPATMKPAVKQASTRRSREMQVTETTDASRSARAERMRTALGRIKAWLRSNNAEGIVDNLAPPTSVEEIAACAKVLGLAIPDDLRELWLLHGGQNVEKTHPFLGSHDLLSPATAASVSHDFLSTLPMLRDAPDDLVEVTEEELASDEWLTIGKSGRWDVWVICAATGRLFGSSPDYPQLYAISGSLLDWLETFAEGAENGEYEVIRLGESCFVSPIL